MRLPAARSGGFGSFCRIIFIRCRTEDLRRSRIFYYHGLYSVASMLNANAGPHSGIGLDGVLISRPLLLFEEDYRGAHGGLREA